MLLKVVNTNDADGALVFKDIILREGAMILLPGHTPHNTFDVVLEQKSPPKAAVDRMRWYSPAETCRAVIRDAAFKASGERGDGVSSVVWFSSEYEPE